MATVTWTTYDKDGKVVGSRTETTTPEQDNREALDSRMDAALDGLRTYIANTSPTAAQTTAVVKLLCRIAIAVIRHRFARYEGMD